MSAFSTKDGRFGATTNGAGATAQAAHIGEAYMGMMRDSMELSAEWTQRLLNCKSMPEVAEVNTECARKAMESWIGMMTEMSNAATSTISPTMEAASKRSKR